MENNRVEAEVLGPHKILGMIFPGQAKNGVFSVHGLIVSP